jgi:hypothetical protein
MQQRFSPQVDHLWPLLVLVGFGSIGSLIPIDQVDFWWHIAAGREIVQLGAVPTTTSSSWVLPDHTPFVLGSWLAEWLLYQLYLLGGIPAIVLSRNLLLLAAFTVVGLDARRRSGSWRLAALAIGGAAVMALNNISVRPQMFAWCLFAATAALLGAFRARQIHHHWLWLLPPLMIAWANLHGSFVLGLGLLMITCCGELGTVWLRRQQQLSRQELQQLITVTLLCSLGIFVNPRGIGILTFVGDLVSNPAVQGWVGEWQPPDLLGVPGIVLPFLGALTALGWRRSRRFNLTDALLLAVFGLLAAGAIRNVIWFGMIAWPVAVGAWRRNTATTRSRLRSGAHRPVILPLAASLVLAVPLVLVQPPFKAGFAVAPVFAGMGHVVPDGVYLGHDTPIEAIAWLKTHPLPADARLFHDMRYGSYLLWAMPQVRVCIDGRIELYSLAQWEQYRRIVANNDALAELARMNATHALLNLFDQPDLIATLRTPDSGWQPIYTDAQTIIFARTRRT